MCNERGVFAKGGGYCISAKTAIDQERENRLFLRGRAPRTEIPLKMDRFLHPFRGNLVVAGENIHCIPAPVALVQVFRRDASSDETRPAELNRGD